MTNKVAVQGELDLMYVVKLEEGLLPRVICMMYTNQLRTYWRNNPDYDSQEMHGFGGPARHIKATEVKKELTLATFDEKTLKAHVEQWGRKTHEKPSYCGSDMKEQFETWLTYEKIEFNQLQGVRMYPDEKSVEIELDIKARDKRS